MVLDFEYGINTGNRFLDFVDHDEDPDEFIAIQTKPEEKPKKSTKETKSVTSKKTTTTTPSATTTNVSSNTTKVNKENFSGKSTNTDQRRQQSNAFSDNNNQQTRNESGRGRGFPRRGGSAGQDRPPYEGGNRGGGQQRSQRFNKFEGQQTSNETSGFDQSSDAWGGETTNDNNQSFGGYRGRGRGGPRRGNFEGGRGNYEGGRGNYEGGRGGGRGRGRGGRGYFNNRSVDESSQQQQQPQTQDSSHWQQPTESNFDNTRSQSAKTSGDAGQELDADVPVQDRSFEPDNTQRGGRGQFRSRTFRNNRHYGGDRQSQYERGTGDVSQDEYRHNRRQHDRQPRTNVSSVKAVEKKDGDGAHNWGHQTENPEEHPVPDETAETTAQPGATQKDWAQQVDEAEKQMTLDEYKKQIEAKKQAHQEKLPQFNRRTAGEGEDPNNWQNFKHLYRKKTDDESNDEELEEGSGDEEDENEEDAEEEQISGKKKVITIPLHFKPIEMPRGPAGSRGGPRRGGGRPYRDRPYRDDQTRSKSPSQQTPSSQQTGEYHNDEQQPRPYRGGARQGSGRGEYRRSYVNSARGSRGGYNRSNIDPNTPDFDNKVDFPTLAKP